MPVAVTWQGISPNQLLETCKTHGINSKLKIVRKNMSERIACCGLIELQDWLLVHEIKATLDAAPPSDWIKTTNHVGETYWFNKASGQTSIASPLSKRLQSMVDHHRKLGGKLVSDSSIHDRTLMVLLHSQRSHVRRSMDTFSGHQR